MSSYRRCVLIVGAIVLVGMTLFPPWSVVINGNTIEVLGYSPIFSPPARPLTGPTPRSKGLDSRGSAGWLVDQDDRSPPPEPRPGTQIDLTRLLIQYFAVMVISGVAFAIHTRRPAIVQEHQE